MGKTRILFVCLGNICRSPAAEEIMRRKVTAANRGADFELDSAGTYGGHAGENSDPRMRAAGRERGYRIEHTARKITPDDFDGFDLIVTMDDSNYHNVRRMAPSLEAQEKILRMADFLVRSTDRDHIPDPYYEGSEGFYIVLDLLEEACEELLRQTLNGELPVR